VDWSAIVGGVFGLLAAGLGALLAYALGERRAEKERVRAAIDRREQELAVGRLDGAALLAQMAMLLEDCKGSNRYLWSNVDERRRELRSRGEALQTGLYRFASSPLFPELSVTINVLAQVSHDLVTFSTRDRTSLRQSTYELDKARFDEILVPWRYLRAKLSLEDILREPTWGFSPEMEAVSEKWIQQQEAHFKEATKARLQARRQGGHGEDTRSKADPPSAQDSAE
jgi:hypothetical protein